MHLSFVHSVLALSSKRAPITISTMVKKARVNSGQAKERADITHVPDAEDADLNNPHTPVKKFDKTPGAYSSAEKKSQATRHWNRVASGQVVKATKEDVEEARKALGLLRDLPDDQKVDFVNAFCQGKPENNFAFIKDFEESFNASKEVKKTVTENRMTRIFC